MMIIRGDLDYRLFWMIKTGVSIRHVSNLEKPCLQRTLKPVSTPRIGTKNKRAIKVARLIMERKLGRSLLRTEAIRHLCNNYFCFEESHLLLGAITDKYDIHGIRYHHQAAATRPEALLKLLNNCKKTPFSSLETPCRITTTKTRAKVTYIDENLCVKQQLATRALYEEVHNVVVTNDEIIRHRCSRELCLEITHLILGTHDDNAVDLHNDLPEGVNTRLRIELAEIKRQLDEALEKLERYK